MKNNSCVAEVQLRAGSK